ncbi:lysylphosphatidylglycerol synthase transmembrane domain-containing protein [Bacteroides sp. 519]|uniref:lysylphosphatidylglycerol synthase transmembrane domain-containing protein n=1 Tax=Bacteroides sp. 519 TaxID=2302937 RepID=UPI0013CFE659|nr:lysylphosphatidylglycerol synthase transmembrane domain-containing protein [Bacteroides sp. 519]NDV58350.1 UPF0104 family protein [Bacteroides sp. 519]
MNKLIKKTLKIVFPLLLGGGILIWVYRDFDFENAKQTLLYGMNWWWMIASLFFGIMSHIIRGWRWKMTLAAMDAYPKTSNCINAVFVSYATNLVLPRVGEISRCGILAKYDGISFSKSLGTVVSERIIDSLCVGLITAMAMLTQMKTFTRFFEATGTDIHSITDVFTSPQFYIVLFSIIAIAILLYFLLRTLSFFEKVKGVVLNIWEGVISLRKVRNFPLFVLYTVLIWGCYFLQFYITFYCFSFSAGLGILAGLVLFVGGTIAVIVPTPNGAGPWHFAVISMMMLYGVSNPEAATFALIVHGIQTLLVIVLGVYGLLALPVMNKKRVASS